MNKAIWPFALIQLLWPYNMCQIRQYGLKSELERKKVQNNIANSCISQYCRKIHNVAIYALCKAILWGRNPAKRQFLTLCNPGGEEKFGDPNFLQLWLYTMHCTLNTVHYTARYKLYTVCYNVHCTPYTIHCKLYTGHYKLYCTIYTIHYKRYTIHYTLCTIHCTLNTVHYTLYFQNQIELQYTDYYWIALISKRTLKWPEPYYRTTFKILQKQ